MKAREESRTLVIGIRVGCSPEAANVRGCIWPDLYLPGALHANLDCTPPAGNCIPALHRELTNSLDRAHRAQQRQQRRAGDPTESHRHSVRTSPPPPPPPIFCCCCCMPIAFFSLFFLLSSSCLHPIYYLLSVLFCLE